MILVIAGNFEQARQWAFASGHEKGWRYVYTPDQMRGVAKATIVKTGTYWENERYWKILDEAKYLVATGRAVWEQK